MKLLYLTESNLRDRLFIKDLVFNYKLKEKAILIHDSFGETVRDTRFVTKRISALLSENMVYNNAFSAEQRDMFYLDPNGEMEINTEKILGLLSPIQLLILGPVIKQAGESVLADPLQMVEICRTQMEIDEVIVFTENPLSPLGTKNIVLNEREEVDRLAKIYDEEAQALELAWQLRPARLSSPNNFARP